MVRQSRALPVPVLLTRPAAQGARLAAELRARFGHRVQLIKTPLLAPSFHDADLSAQTFAALILTSQTAVEGYRRLVAKGRQLPGLAFCVGDQTAEMASAAGLQAKSAAGNASALVALIKQQNCAGPLLHLRGAETRGGVTEQLNSAGIETHEAVVYTQQPQPLTAEAKAALQLPNPVLLPLYSPRTAEVFAAQARQIGWISPLFVAALSGEVAKSLPLHKDVHLAIARKPDAGAMLEVLADLLRSAERA